MKCTFIEWKVNILHVTLLVEEKERSRANKEMKSDITYEVLHQKLDHKKVNLILREPIVPNEVNI